MLLLPFFSKRMKLDKDTHQLVIDELERIHNGGKAEDIQPEIKVILEELTGIPYEKCFGNNTIGYHATEKNSPIEPQHMV
ncbi:hypothetical protein [Melissococcus plutonius]|uniref:Permease of the Na, galactoside symporter family n=1 Tax=Melissococcus plutonius (strain ATCC 35311 / DSM 29964 / CIP 104052 / LMG 20360 / NCIMB 702443) TaxID=940190 RepID=F3Y8Y5_MELPT|nr:hypothetical protein [Melissococcus plutonius]BAK20963.1 permease of the Na, galactoside symporter family [Melissococcus plutonius ATCC 35311]